MINIKNLNKIKVGKVINGIGNICVVQKIINLKVDSLEKVIKPNNPWQGKRGPK